MDQDDHSISENRLVSTFYPRACSTLHVCVYDNYFPRSRLAGRLLCLVKSQKTILCAEYGAVHRESALQAELEGLAHALHHVLEEKIYHVQIFVDCKVISQFFEDPLSDVEVEIPIFPWFDRLRPLCKKFSVKVACLPRHLNQEANIR